MPTKKKIKKLKSRSRPSKRGTVSIFLICVSSDFYLFIYLLSGKEIIEFGIPKLKGA